MAEHRNYLLELIFCLILLQNLTNAQEIEASQLIPSGYDSQLRPSSDGKFFSVSNHATSILENVRIAGPLNVSVSVYIDELLGISEGKSFQVDLYLLLEWLDHRLNVANMTHDLVITQSSSISLFWLPDFYFANSASASVVNALQTIQELTVTPEGALQYRLRMNPTFACSMYLLNFPHDWHVCSFQMSSCMISIQGESVRSHPHFIKHVFSFFLGEHSAIQCE